MGAVLHGEGPEGAELEERRDQPLGGLRHHDLPRLRELLHPRRRVRGVAHRRVVHAEVVADGADDHEARVESHAHAELDPAGARQLLAIAGKRRLHGEGRIRGALRVVLVRDRRPEERHEPVAEELVGCPLVTVDLGEHGLERAVDQRVHVLGIESLGNRGESGDIGESTVTCLRSPVSAERSFRMRSARCAGVYACGDAKRAPPGATLAGPAAVGADATAMPQAPQNRAPGVMAAPHAAHATSSRAPHCSQNRTPVRCSLWQAGQRIPFIVRSDRAARALVSSVGGRGSRAHRYF